MKSINEIINESSITSCFMFNLMLVLFKKHKLLGLVNTFYKIMFVIIVLKLEIGSISSNPKIESVNKKWPVSFSYNLLPLY